MGSGLQRGLAAAPAKKAARKKAKGRQAKGKVRRRRKVSRGERVRAELGRQIAAPPEVSGTDASSKGGDA